MVSVHKFLGSGANIKKAEDHIGLMFGKCSSMEVSTLGRPRVHTKSGMFLPLVGFALRCVHLSALVSRKILRTEKGQPW